MYFLNLSGLVPKPNLLVLSKVHQLHQWFWWPKEQPSGWHDGKPYGFLSVFQLRLVCWCMGPREDTEGRKLKKITNKNINYRKHLQSHPDFIIWPWEGILHLQWNYVEYALWRLCTHASMLFCSEGWKLLEIQNKSGKTSYGKCWWGKAGEWRKVGL